MGVPRSDTHVPRSDTIIKIIINLIILTNLLTFILKKFSKTMAFSLKVW